MKPTGQMDMQTCVYARLTDVYLINVFFSSFTEAVDSNTCRPEDGELPPSASP